jgi:protein ImuB
MKRIICIRLPSWPVQRLVVAQPALKGRAIILYGRAPRRGHCVVACSQAAYRLGVRRGMPLAEASTFDAQAHLAPHDASADAATLTALAQWCEQFSPLVSLDHQAADSTDNASTFGASAYLMLDATGLAAHFGGEEALARQIAHAFTQRGYCVRVAMADTVGAAWALAHYATQAAHTLASAASAAAVTAPASGSTFLVLPATESWALLQSLPMRALRLPADTAALLEQLGLLRIGQLAQLPRESLAMRFGDLLLQRWDQLLGHRAEVLRAYHEPPAFCAELSLEHPAQCQAALLSVLAPLVDQVARAVAAHSEGILELVARFRCSAPIASRDEEPESPPERAPAAALSLRVSLFQATASGPHLFQLARMQLEQLTLPGPVEQVTVEASLTAPLAQQQQELFPDRRRQIWLPLAQLIDRLSSRLGAAAVAHPQLEADAQPEQAYSYVPLTQWRRGSTRRTSLSRVRRRQPRARPLHVRSPPLPLAVVAIVPDGPPIRFDWQQRSYRITRHWGPERIETGWWRGRSVRRDYYRVETDGGHWFWIFRQLHDGQWFLHGLFG